LKVAREFGVGTGTVQRIKDEMVRPFRRRGRRLKSKAHK